MLFRSKTSFDPFPQKLTNININVNSNNINQKTKSLINQTINNYQTDYSDSCRVYIRPSGTEPLIRVLVEAKDEKIVQNLSSKITTDLSFEINKILS